MCNRTLLVGAKGQSSKGQLKFFKLSTVVKPSNLERHGSSHKRRSPRGVLVPFQNCSVFPCSHSFSLFHLRLTYLPTKSPHHQKSPSKKSFRGLVVTAFPKTGSCSLRYFFFVPLFPKTPRRPSQTTLKDKKLFDN